MEVASSHLSIAFFFFLFPCFGNRGRPLTSKPSLMGLHGLKRNWNWQLPGVGLPTGRASRLGGQTASGRYALVFVSVQRRLNSSALQYSFNPQLSLAQLSSRVWMGQIVPNDFAADTGKELSGSFFWMVITVAFPNAPQNPWLSLSSVVLCCSDVSNWKLKSRGEVG